MVASDEELMSRLAQGDMGSLGDLVQRHQQGVGAFAFRMLGNRDTADDVVQDAFLHVHRAARRYRPDAKFTTWLYSIVVNLCRDAARRSRRAPCQLSEDAAPGFVPPADPIEARERVERVRRAVEGLPGRQRTAVILHRYQGFSHRDIARATGWSESAVESLIVRAYATLREKLADLKP